jgi:hypothetical protein
VGNRLETVAATHGRNLEVQRNQLRVAAIVYESLCRFLRRANLRQDLVRVTLAEVRANSTLAFLNMYHQSPLLDRVPPKGRCVKANSQ